MSKFFNIAGPCFSDEHYMVPIDATVDKLKHLVSRQSYFVVHAARQTGKTTLIQNLVLNLNEEGSYYAIYCSLESAGVYSDADTGMQIIASMLVECLHNLGKDVPSVDLKQLSGVLLRRQIQLICESLDRPLVIMFDEADCLRGTTLLSFLRQLREGYINRKVVPFAYSVALVGMRNLRDYRPSIREPDETLGSASPFNIITQTITLKSFRLDELKGLLKQHGDETGEYFPEDVCEAIYYWSGGQPWLCNALANEILSGMTADSHTGSIEVGSVEAAKERIIRGRFTHIDSLLARLNEPRVQVVLEPVILGQTLDVDLLDDDTRYVFELGLLRFERGAIQPSNPIYREVIMRHLTYNTQYKLPIELENRFIIDGAIDMSALLKSFQEFWRENSDIWIERHHYKEAAPHLVLQAFLQRIVNGGATISREYAAGRGRLDLCVSMAENRYPIELKIFHDHRSRTDGIEQLKGYMARLGLQEGWLIIFNRNEDISWNERIYWETIKEDVVLLHILGC